MVWFAIREEGWESEVVFGPFANRKVAADFIEKEEDNNEITPWWADDWFIYECEIAEKWDDWHCLHYYNAKPYRQAYCKEMRKQRDEQWRKDNPMQAQMWDKISEATRGMLGDTATIDDILEDLQFGQEI